MPNPRAMDRRYGLDDPQDSGFAWRRYRRILAAMNIVALAVGVGAAWLLWQMRGPLPPLFLLLVALGLYATVMMAAALMGLIFLSSGTGHDEQIIDFTEGEHPRDD